jgi:hypothetical protein
MRSIWAVSYLLNLALLHTHLLSLAALSPARGFTAGGLFRAALFFSHLSARPQRPKQCLAAILAALMDGDPA